MRYLHVMKFRLFIIVLFSTTLLLNAQRHEYGISVGGTYYIGDINPGFHFKGSSPAAGAFYRFNAGKYWSFRLNGFYGRIQGADSTSKDFKSRNLSFKSPLLEIGGMVEWHFYSFQPGKDGNLFTPYLFTGISWYKFNPKGSLNGQWYNLQALGTEGQGTTTYPDRKPYSLAGISIPMGMGIKIALGTTTVLGFEWGVRKTFTDYLDDVSTTYADPAVLASQNSTESAYLADPGEIRTGELPVSKAGMQRGNSSTKDWYGYACITLSFQIQERSSFCPGMKRSKVPFIVIQKRKLKQQPAISF